ncbi:DUF3825 domain-containing protein [Laspinema palackyanum]|uniref:DUF3825 domain-containing protein n=1 Tax=Laspinema palackyanum TaxID=3231601 RepID=UPI00345D414D|nr:DUF3825 domain-containing protein [Laspinema sp. D2c]
MINKEDLLEQYGSPRTRNLLRDCLYSFSFITQKALNKLNEQSLQENWGKELDVLKKYIAITLYWSIEQEKFLEYKDGFIVAAGLLRNRYNVPLYLKFEPNQRDDQPWRLTDAGTGENFSDEEVELPPPPEVPKAPEIPLGNEIVISDEHILRDNVGRVEFLAPASTVTQICALNGAIQWSIYKGLYQPCWYYGKMQYFIPIYLKSQENITTTPDLIAPLEVREGKIPLRVRTVMNPIRQTTYYSNIRPVVARADQLQPWIISSWNEAMLSQNEMSDEDD